MDGYVTDPFSRGSRCRGSSDQRSKAASVSGHHGTSMMLLKKHRTTFGGDILPVQLVDVLALCSSGMLTPFPLLEILDLSGGVLANAWFISVGADDDKFLSLLL
jgi:hypothetical protein